MVSYTAVRVTLRFLGVDAGYHLHPYASVRVFIWGLELSFRFVPLFPPSSWFATLGLGGSRGLFGGIVLPFPMVLMSHFKLSHPLSHLWEGGVLVLLPLYHVQL